jgi:hypothetical protein
MTRTNFLLGVAVSLVLPLACLLYGLSASQPAEAAAIAMPAREGGANMERVQQRFVQLLRSRVAR